jgi:hypothetical protein
MTSNQRQAFDELMDLAAEDTPMPEEHFGRILERFRTFVTALDTSLREEKKLETTYETDHEATEEERNGP